MHDDTLRPCTRVLAVTLTLLLSGALALNAQEPMPTGLACPGEYVIGPEDVLDVAVWNNTDISRTVPVRPDGKISLPLLNDVQAAGRTPMQLRDVLVTTLTAYIAAPVVSVIVREIHSFKVTVIGEVKTTGRYELKSRATVLDVLAMAGGPTDYAARGRILVLRQEGASTRQIPVALEKLTAKSAHVCLMPGDIVVVP